MGFFPSARIDDHLPVDKSPKDLPFPCFICGSDVFHIHEQIGDELEGGLQKDVIGIFEE